MKRLTVLPLSLWGQAETVKSNLLPRLAFVISFPLKFTTKWFKEINKIIRLFVEKSKTQNQLQKTYPIPKQRRSWPSRYLYYIAYNLSYPLKWAYSSQREIGSWEWLEEKIIKEHNSDLSLTTLWYCPNTIKNINNPILRVSGEIIRMQQKYLQFNGNSVPSCPFWCNPLFMAGKSFREYFLATKQHSKYIPTYH